jgi:peptidoglycan hydrolase-like protein with peptidoglycan-binding domain
MPILKQGSSGPDVKDLQQKLTDLGFDPKGVDGNFGPGTQAAVIAFQQSKGLQADGIAGPATLAALQSDGGDAATGGSTTDAAATADTADAGGSSSSTTSSRILAEDDYTQAAALIRCDVAAIKAVAEVESRGAGFLPDGRPKILFERHKFHAFTGGKYDATHPDISNKSPGGYGAGGTHQWDRFDEAAALDETAAIKSCSWGKFQAMGFNFKVCGFANVDDFHAAMMKSEGEHLKAFCNFIAGNNLDGALRNHQWAKVAEGYNGANYKINQYDTKLAAAYKKYSNQ